MPDFGCVLRVSAALAALFASTSGNAKSFADIYQSFTNFDLDDDGQPEINFVKGMVDGTSPGSKPWVLVLVESRLTQTISGVPTKQAAALKITPALIQYMADLEAGGYTARMARISLYAGPADQDGLTLLAMRELLRALRTSFPSLQGVVLVGNFPNAVLVRRVLREKAFDDSKVTITKVNGSATGKALTAIPYEANWSAVQVSAAQVADVADIVLADLDGDWESRYLKSASFTGLYAIVVGKPKAGAAGTFQVPLFGTDSKETQLRPDVFFLDDSPFKLTYKVGTQVTKFSGQPNEALLGQANVVKSKQWCEKCTLQLFPPENGEVAPAGLAKSNPISTPSIYVSRINTKHVAISPDPGLVNGKGQGLLGSNGQPQAVTFDKAALAAAIQAKKVKKLCGAHYAGDGFDCLWSPDAVLERKLLNQYFSRNHAFRVAKTHSKWLLRPAAIGFELGIEGLYDVNIKLGSPDWSSLTFEQAKQDGTAVPEATLIDYVTWLKVPAILRGIKAHSNWKHSLFGKVDSLALEKATFAPWRYTVTFDGSSAVVAPSFKDQAGAADFYLYRTLYQHQAMLWAGPRIYVHEGCETMSITGNGSPTVGTYAQENFGRRQNAESLLFYANGLAVVGRALVNNDWIDGLTMALGEGANLGVAMDGYYDKQASQNGADLVAAKNAYGWNIYGDWTLWVPQSD